MMKTLPVLAAALACAAGLKAAGIDDPAAHYKGKAVRATGTVKEVHGVPRIEVEEAKQIRVVER